MADLRDSALARLEESLASAVSDGVTPGAAGACARFRGGAWQALEAASGRLEPGGAPVERHTPYDLASVTKPFVAMAALRLVARGVLDLTHAVAHYIPELADTHGGAQSIAALLSHRAGLSPWGGLFHVIPAPIASAETRAFMLREAARRTDPDPVSEGSVYSDLGFMLAGEVVARASALSLDQVVSCEVTDPLQLSSRIFYAAALDTQARAELVARVAPTEFCAWRGRIVRGEVHDENCAAYGGIAGHAGLFGDVGSVLRFGMAMLDVLAGRSTWLDREVLRAALTPQPGGGHVIGWDTKSETGSSAGSLFSATSFGHLGFTGTSLWCDPERELCAALLTNRVHPTRDNVAIRTFRPRFHDEVVAAMA